MKMVLSELIKKIRCLVLDVDGVLTDGTLWFNHAGEIIKAFHIHDGYGLQRLKTNGIHVAVISGRDDPCVVHRLQTLRIEPFFLGHVEKMPAYLQLLEQLELTDEAIAYMGDDLPDIPIMQRVGFSIAVANAVTEVKAIADWQTQHSGGHGAVREICDLILDRDLK